jgi:hypothetical protein
MTKTLLACLTITGLAAIAASAAFAKNVTVELTPGQFLANCRAQGGTMSYGADTGATCTLPNGTKITCAFVGHLASCETPKMAPATLDTLLKKK